jgi:hypothetical protein
MTKKHLTEKKVGETGARNTVWTFLLDIFVRASQSQLYKHFHTDMLREMVTFSTTITPSIAKYPQACSLDTLSENVQLFR